MTEVSLKELALDSLFDLMLRTFQELLDALDKEIKETKENELAILQRVIVAKVAELYPVDNLLYFIFSN